MPEKEESGVKHRILAPTPLSIDDLFTPRQGGEHRAPRRPWTYRLGYRVGQVVANDRWFYTVCAVLVLVLFGATIGALAVIWS
jgi:hypothetical protein